MTPPISSGAGYPASSISVNPDRRKYGTTAFLQPTDPQKRRSAITLFRGCGMAALLMGATTLAGCANKFIPPDIDYDDGGVLAKLVGDPPLPVRVVELPKPLPLPGQLKPLGNGKPVPEAPDPAVRVNQANAAARVQPVRNGFINAVQVYPFASGALYQVYTAPGEITDVALQEGEQLVGSGPVAAGDTVRWIIGDTESGAGAARKIHILVKPTRPDITTNLVINTDRRTYLLELRSTEKTYMASVSWQYPEDQLIALRRQNQEAQDAAPIDKGIDLACDQLPLCDPGRQSRLASAARLRRRAEGLYRVPARHPPGRDAAALRHRTRRRLGTRQLSRQPQFLHRRSPVRRRRAPARRQGQRAARPHRPQRWKAALMVTEGGEEDRAAPSVAPPDLRLRGEPPRVTRLSRKVLIGLGAASALAIAGALGYALQPHDKAQNGEELLSIQNRPSAEGLSGLPKDYTGLPRQVPQLGPPLPGDLGKPILNAGVAPTTIGAAPDAEAQRVAQEMEAARVSRLFAQTSQQSPAIPIVTPPATPGIATGADVDAGGRRGLGAEHAGPQDGLSQRLDRPANGQRRSASDQGLALCRPGRHGDPRGAHHGHPFGLARPDHRPGDGSRL